ncbi:MAG TPA: ATP-binding protein [Longimicrobium sp.]|nr:ATP-binding protein [Longimicrobium sp.]
MANPLRDLFFGPSQNDLVAAVPPRRTFADVVLPAATRRALDQALVQIRKHDVLFGQWGLGERHDTGLGLAFNFAGPPGTGKTICAEAIAHALGKKLLVVRYAELESQWAGMTAKNLQAVFASAAEQDAVLLFDEADAIAGRRFTSVDQGYQREANAVVNVLLREVEEFPGVVIFATNLAANFDPAFERRIRTHILFEMPGPDEREKIWKAQIHARKTPLAPDVDFRALAERYPGSGGDIKNAVLKAAQAAIAEPGEDGGKRIAQRHFVEAMEAVLAAKRVMDQSIFGDQASRGAAALGAAGLVPGDDGRQQLEDEVGALSSRLVEVEDSVAVVPEALRRLEVAQKDARAAAEEAARSIAAERAATAEAVQALERALGGRLRSVFLVAAAALVLALAALLVAVF